MKKYLEKVEDDIDLQMLAETYFLSDKKKKGLRPYKNIIAKPSNGTLHITLADYYRDSGDNEKSFNELILALKVKI